MCFISDFAKPQKDFKERKEEGRITYIVDIGHS